VGDRDRWIEVGVAVKPHGIRGEVIVDLKRDLVEFVIRGTVVRITGNEGDEVQLGVEDARPHAGRLIVKFRGVDTRNEAEELRSRSLWLTREQIGALPEGRYFVQDILGLEVYCDTGERLGLVGEVLCMPANDVYVVDCAGEEILLPVIDDVIREIDLERGRIVVHLMKGLRREGE
jgi:16S rRNA processing protein RimM